MRKTSRGPFTNLSAARKNIVWVLIGSEAGTDHDLDELGESRVEESIERLSGRRVRECDEA